MPRAPAIALSHGGGPMPVLGDETHRDITASLSHRVPQILKLGTPEAPRAIVLVTAHWSTDRPTISSGKKHDLYYDYGGFPPASYQLKYDAPGSPEVAEEIRQAMEKEGLDPVLNERRGWDHGVFIPLLLINPRADIPVVQLSVLNSESPAAHFAMGRALSKLRDTGVAVVGSGFATIHNMRVLRQAMMGSARSAAAVVDEWSAALESALAESDRDERERKLAAWRLMPHAYDVHPRGGAEHFLPLLVVAGTVTEADGPVKKFSDDFSGVDIWTYYWGDVEVK